MMVSTMELFDVVVFTASCFVLKHVWFHFDLELHPPRSNRPRLL
jgi:hypothetical protein